MGLFGDDVKEKEEQLEKLKLENEVEQEKVSLAEKKALEGEAKQRYGRDWKKVLGLAKHLKISKENLMTLHSMGVGGERLRELTNPFNSRISRYR